MEATPANIQAVATYLTHTLSENYQVRKQAEDFLISVETTQNYPMLLLQITDDQTIDTHTRQAASIVFKNFVKRNWRIVDKTSTISDVDRQLIKTHIVSLMLKSPEALQKQLSDAITIIGREDFPNNWPGLIEEMVGHFKTGDFHVINGVLRTAHSLTKRYRHEFKSQELWMEILVVLDGLAAPLTELLEATMRLASTNSQNPIALKVLFSSLLFIAKIFYNLTYQELPDHFAEKNLEPWMVHFHTLLTTTNKLLETDGDEEAGPLELVKSQICSIATMLAQKYDEDFSPFLSDYVKTVWNLLVSTDARPKHDMLVSMAIEFLASVIERPSYQHLFSDETTLRTICENVVVPNMKFRESDEELFEDNAEEYLRRDLEGSDIGTRRHSASNLIRGLSRYFEGPITTIFSSYISAMLQEYQQDPVKNWKSKDTALYLISALATRSKNSRHGITQTSDLVNVADIFTVQCIPELSSPDVNKQAVLRADSIRFLITFRGVLPRPLLLQSLPLLLVHLTSNNTVVHTYAAHCIEKLLLLRLEGGAMALLPEDIQPHLETLLTNLFNCLRKEGSLENEYIMKAIMRSFSTMKESIVPYGETLLKELVAKLALVCQNPSKPHFNHYLFESICCIIRYSCKVNQQSASKFEEALFPIIESILVQDVAEFLPYIFQILSLLLELRPSPIPPAYMTIYPHLLSPTLWERPGNIPALVRLLQAFIEKAPTDVVASNRLTNLLGVFQKLIASKSNDHEGFYILGTMIEHIDMSVLRPQMKDVFTLLFRRLQSSKTTKYVKSLVVFVCLYAGKHGGSELLQLVDSIQPKLFAMLLEKVIIADVQKVSGSTERKICAIGITKILTETPEMLSDMYMGLWLPLLQALISLFELPEEGTPEDETFIEIEETPGYQATYSQLIMAGSKDYDPFQSLVPNAKLLLAQSLHRLSSEHPGRFSNMITTGLTDEATLFLQQYLQQANISTLL
ncbi:PREDICTED: exportin-2-like [Amphimedon queenslandica]|uniref:Exportin-2 n=1 Tax=Amphimedon queenslandica TaxID=400682 RepID=A0A1X7UWW9_AMPQE|nr:PREDICTED: exportin-2-like [Amphimedon queenslandica]|eukprot:XP_003386477.1 PREDICTED: exportin-2-like [Amphimedon queenslandica]